MSGVGERQLKFDRPARTEMERKQIAESQKSDETVKVLNIAAQICAGQVKFCLLFLPE